MALMIMIIMFLFSRYTLLIDEVAFQEYYSKKVVTDYL